MTFLPERQSMTAGGRTFEFVIHQPQGPKHVPCGAIANRLTA